MISAFFSTIILSLVCGGWSTYVAPIPRPPICNNGQIYWCKNITTAAECNAVPHCIRGVWEHEVPIEVDKSSICQTCVDMVKLARDQLESNETQEELRQVLEATCDVVPVKVLREDCDKLMDDFGSYLVDTLASEMNPQVVCSIAGLCNSNRFVQLEEPKMKVELNCDNCYDLVKQIEGSIETASSNDLYFVLADICGNFGSYSDACSTIIHNNLEKVDALIRNNIKASPVCALAGACKERYHNHDKPSFLHVPLGEVEIVKVKEDDADLPCELCIQLVKHLRDVLIANTTEEEFKMVISGLCKMTSFKDECDDVINQYYPAIYEFLVTELNGTILCKQINICPKEGTNIVRPLLIDVNNEKKQLPIERMFPLTYIKPSALGNVKQSTMLCSFCEYFLHFAQKELTLPSTEKEMTEVLINACEKLPVTVASECNSFIQSYLPAFVALLANRIDPSQVCPNLGVCPGSLMAVEYNDKPTCPLCLLAVEATLTKISNKTQLEIDDALDDLCIRDVFPNTLSTECVKFITDYRSQITDMIIAEFTPQEACVYAEICAVPKHPAILPHHQHHEKVQHEIVSAGIVETNEIVETTSPSVCVLCEFIMSKLEDLLKNKTTEEEIKDTVIKICNHLPRTITTQCKNFVLEYADFILDLLSQEIEPKQICIMLDLCGKANTLIRSPIKRCLMCELLMDGLKTVMTEPEIEDSINVKLFKACKYFPEDHVYFCRKMVEVMAPQIEAALRSLPVGPLVCHRVHMCTRSGTRAQLIKMVGPKGKCYLGSDYWCKSTSTAARCQQIEYCQKHVWRSDKPRKLIKKGSVIY